MSLCVWLIRCVLLPKFNFVFMCLIDQMCPASKDYSFVQKHVLCCSITFAYIILVLLGTRFVNHWAQLENFSSWFSFTLCSYSVFLLSCNRQFLISYFLQELFQLGAETISPNEPLLSADDLVDQIADVLNYFG